MNQSIGRGILKRLFKGPDVETGAMNDMKLLIVDDEERFLYSMQKLLTRKGCEVRTAASGEACLDILRDKQIDVVILDIKMPGMDGLEVLRRIRRYHPMIEVVLLTGHATVEAAVDGLKNGAADFLMKPISAPDLMEKVKEAFSRRRATLEKLREAQSRRFMKQSPGDIIKDARQAGPGSGNE